MTKRQIYYTRITMVLLAIAMIVVGVAVHSGATTVLVLVGLGILIGTSFVNRIARYIRLGGRVKRGP